MRREHAAIPVIVLAGQRNGSVDPLAAATGVSHKCLVPVAGRPLIAWVLEAAAASEDVSTIFVSTDSPPVLDAVPGVRELREAGRLTTVPALPNLVDSVRAAAKQAGFPVVLTTADNALLTPAGIRSFTRAARSQDAEVAIAFARRADVLDAHPEGQIRFYEFSDEAYSNCNLFWFGSERALEAAESFREGGQFAKHPGRILRAFGVVNLLAFRMRLRTLAGTLRALSRRFGVRIAGAIAEDGALAIDVDNERTRAIAEELLAAREKRLRRA